MKSKQREKTERQRKQNQYLQIQHESKIRPKQDKEIDNG